MARIERIVRELQSRTNNFTKPCTIEMKVDNQKIVITPCNYTGTPEYFLVSGFESTGFNTIEEVAEYINNYEKHKSRQRKEIYEITKYFNEEISKGKGDWDWYSDWHKDVFGFRPHGMVCGQYVNSHVMI